MLVTPSPLAINRQGYDGPRSGKHDTLAGGSYFEFSIFLNLPEPTRPGGVLGVIRFCVALSVANEESR
jgi:hypothetical protein